MYPLDSVSYGRKTHMWFIVNLVHGALERSAIAWWALGAALVLLGFMVAGAVRIRRSCTSNYQELFPALLGLAFSLATCAFTYGDNLKNQAVYTILLGPMVAATMYSLVATGGFLWDGTCQLIRRNHARPFGFGKAAAMVPLVSLGAVAAFDLGSRQSSAEAWWPAAKGYAMWGAGWAAYAVILLLLLEAGVSAWEWRERRYTPPTVMAEV